MAELKTKPNRRSVEDFINAVPDDQRRLDCLTVRDDESKNPMELNL